MHSKSAITPCNIKLSWLKAQIDQSFVWNDSNSIHLDIGSGNRPANPFNANKVIALDIYHVESPQNEKVVKVVNNNLYKLPFDDEMFYSISAYDVIEHIPRLIANGDGKIIYPFIEMMNEISRVLKPGGIFIAVTPAFPKGQAFQDPTHVNIITDETISYFDENNWAKHLGYGFNGDFSKIHQSWLRGSGPYIGRQDSNYRIRKFKYVPKCENKLKIAKRIMFLPFHRSPYSLLWVLRKNCCKDIRS